MTMPTKNKTLKLVPELRFPEFRGTWEEKSLGRLFKQRQEKGDEKLPLLSLTAEQGIIPQGESGRKDNSNADKSRYLKVSKGDIAYNTMRMWEGRSALSNLEGLVSPAYTVCAPQKGTDSKFFSYYIKTSFLIEQFNRNSQGLTKDTYSLKYPSFAKIKVSLPSEPEQQKIADCLGSLDELLAAHRRKLAALQDHKKGLLQQLFPAEGETTPNLRFPGFEGEWETDALSKLVKVYPGFGFPDRLQGNSDGDFPFYKVSDISKCIERGGYQISKSANYVDQNTVDELRAKTLPAGATIFAKIGEAIRLNRRVITTRPCLIDNNAAGVYPLLKDTSFLFLYYLFCTIRLIDYAGGVVPAISKTAIESIIVSWPSPPEQQTIADCLSALDALITAQTDQIAALHAHKKGLMQQLFPNPQGVA
jgi:type I restriction enzyme, S subunit